jgi:hypothetical protein
MMIYFTALLVIVNVLVQDYHLYSCIMNMVKIIIIKY